MNHPRIIVAPWSLTKLAEALDRTPEDVRRAVCRKTFPIPAVRIMRRVYFRAEDVARLLSGEMDHA